MSQLCSRHVVVGRPAIMSVKRAKPVILAVSSLAVLLLMAQVRSPEERTTTMSDSHHIRIFPRGGEKFFS